MTEDEIEVVRAYRELPHDIKKIVLEQILNGSFGERPDTAETQFLDQEA